MINPEHNFDHKIKRALENYQAPYQPDDWLLMEQMLDHAAEGVPAPPKKGVTSLRNSVLVFSLVCLMLMSAGLVYHRIGEYQLQPPPTNMPPAVFTAPQPANYQPAQVINAEQLNGNKAAATAGILSGTGNTKLPPAESALPKTPHTAHNAIEPIAAVLPTVFQDKNGHSKLSPSLLGGWEEQQPNTTHTQQHTALKSASELLPTGMANQSTFNLPIAATNAPPLPDVTNAQPENNHLGAAITNAGNGNLYADAHKTQNLPAATVQPPNATALATPLLAFLPTLKTDLLTAQTTPKQVKTLQTLIINPVQPAAAEPITAIAPKLPPKSGKLTLAAVTSTDANWLSGAQQSGGFSSGVNLSYAIGKHWGISAGALFSQKKWLIAPKQTNALTNMEELTDFGSTENWNNKQQNSIMMNMVEIPVSLTFNMLPGKKMSPYLRAGVSAWLPVQNMVSYNQYNYGSLSQTGTANQTILANMPFMPNPRPNPTISNDNDPLLSTPVIYDDITDLPTSPNIYNTHFQDYWINSNPDFQSVIYVTEHIQIPNAPGINRPIWDIVHLTAGVNYHIGQRWLLLAETRFSSSITRHRFDAKLPTPLQPTQGQRLFSGSMTVGFAYRFK